MSLFSQGRHRGEYNKRYRALGRRLEEEKAERERRNACPICLYLIRWGHQSRKPGQMTHGWGGRRADGTWESVAMCWEHYLVASAHHSLELTNGYPEHG